MKTTSLFFAILLISCAGKKNGGDELTTLYNESMKIHDEIMPRMSQIYRFKTKLLQRRDSLRRDSIRYRARLISIDSSLASLAVADDAMMDWMHHIKGPFKPGDGGNKEEQRKILAGQKEDIEKVKKQMEDAIQNAKSLLERNQ